MAYLASRSVLDLVNRVLLESGVPEVTSITTNISKIALNALNDAASAIWNSNRWTFQLFDSAITLVAGQATYALPAGFDRMAQPFRTSGTVGTLLLQEWTPEEWWGQGLGVATAVGTPAHFKVEQVTVEFWPVPGADFITACPTLEFQYFKGSPVRRTPTEIGSSWDLPLDFEQAHIAFARARLKQFLEDPDGQMDLKDFEQAIQMQINKWRQVRRAPRMRPEDFIVSSWG